MGICNCSCGFDKYDYGNWIEIERTARIKAVCSECEKKIMPGERYIDGWLFNDDFTDYIEYGRIKNFTSYARCLLCNEVMNWADCFAECFIVGGLWGNIDSAIDEDLVDIDSLGQLSPLAFDAIVSRLESEWEYRNETEGLDGWDE
jgi:hypothetical protein